MNGSALLVAAYGDALDDAIFKAKLGALSIKAISRTAKDRRSGALGYAETMVLEYNGRKKGNSKRLPMSKLYSSKKSILAALEDAPTESEEEDTANFMEFQDE